MSQRIEFEGAIHEFPDSFTDADIAEALGSIKPEPSHSGGSNTALAVPAGVGVARGLAAGATRLGEEIATSPLTPRVVNALSGRAMGTIVGGLAGHGATGAAIGYGAGEAASMPAVQSALTAATRSGGGLLARLGGLASRYAGPLGVVTAALTADTQPTTGPVAERAAADQRARELAFIAEHPEYAAEYRRRLAEAGQGRTADIDLPSTRDIAEAETKRIMASGGKK